MSRRAADTAVLQVGDELPVVTKTLTQEKIDRYADASGDHNPLHVNPEIAAGSQFGGTIAHGMLLLAYISEMMTAAFGGWWDGELNVRFRAPARPGDTVTASGRVVERGPAKPDRPRPIRSVCQVKCHNQAGEVLISGKTVVWEH